MKKLLIGLFVSFAAFGIVNKLHALGGTDLSQTWNITQVSLSSAVICNRGCYVQKVWLSSGVSPNTDYALLMDTPAVMANAVIGDFTNNVRIAPAIVFPTTVTANNVNNQPIGMIDFGGGQEGTVYYSSAAFLWKTSDSKGEALKAFVKWRY